MNLEERLRQSLTEPKINVVLSNLSEAIDRDRRAIELVKSVLEGAESVDEVGPPRSVQDRKVSVDIRGALQNAQRARLARRRPKTVRWRQRKRLQEAWQRFLNSVGGDGEAHSQAGESMKESAEIRELPVFLRSEPLKHLADARERFLASLNAKNR